jgi:arylsulfatase A-like enzyme
VDIAPTISDLLDLSIDETAFDGVSLSPDNRSVLNTRKEVFIEERSGETKQAIRTREWKYIRDIGGRDFCRYCNVIHGGKRELYHLFQDGSENTNIADDHPEDCDEFDEILDQWLESLPNPERGHSHADMVDEDILQQLDDLGYIS